MKRLKIKSTVTPTDRPCYLEWCRIYRVSTMYPKQPAR